MYVDSRVMSPDGWPQCWQYRVPIRRLQRRIVCYFLIFLFSYLSNGYNKLSMLSYSYHAIKLVGPRSVQSKTPSCRRSLNPAVKAQRCGMWIKKHNITCSSNQIQGAFWKIYKSRISCFFRWILPALTATEGAYKKVACRVESFGIVRHFSNRICQPHVAVHVVA
jgi:hypothetical protein